MRARRGRGRGSDMLKGARPTGVRTGVQSNKEGKKGDLEHGKDATRPRKQNRKSARKSTGGGGRGRNIKVGVKLVVAISKIGRAHV